MNIQVDMALLHGVTTIPYLHYQLDTHDEIAHY